MILVNQIKPYIPVGIKRVVKGWAIEAKRLTDKNFREYLETGWYRVSYGDKHPDETVMVLQRVDPTSGEYSDWISFLPYCKYAQEHGYKVVIDRKTYHTINYQNEDKYGKENAWEYFFDQPDGLSLETLEQEKYANVLLCRMDNSHCTKYHTFWPTGDLWSLPKSELETYKQIADRYFPLNQQIQKEVAKAYERLLQGKRVLGVSMRMGYAVGFQLGWGGGTHPEHPTLEQTITDAERLMKEWDCDNVFLACDAVEARNAFEKRFGEKLLFVERELTDVSHLPDTMKILKESYPLNKTMPKGLEGLRDQMSVDMVHRSKDYTIETVLLSRCTSLICGKNNGTYAAHVMNGGAYEHEYVYELGVHK